MPGAATAVDGGASAAAWPGDRVEVSETAAPLGGTEEALITDAEGSVPLQITGSRTGPTLDDLENGSDAGQYILLLTAGGERLERSFTARNREQVVPLRRRR